LASQGALERFGIVSLRRGEVVAGAVILLKVSERGECGVQKILFRKERKKIKKSAKNQSFWRRVMHRTHDVYTNGVDNTDDFSRPNVFFFLNERMNA